MWVDCALVGFTGQQAGNVCWGTGGLLAQPGPEVTAFTLFVDSPDRYLEIRWACCIHALLREQKRKPRHEAVENLFGISWDFRKIYNNTNDFPVGGNNSAWQWPRAWSQPSAVNFCRRTPAVIRFWKVPISSIKFYSLDLRDKFGTNFVIVNA